MLIDTFGCFKCFLTHTRRQGIADPDFDFDDQKSRAYFDPLLLIVTPLVKQYTDGTDVK